MSRHFPKGMEVLKDIENNEAIKTNNVITQDLCDDIFTPKVTVYNYSTVLVDSFEVITSLNGTLQTGQQFYQSILPGDSAILNLSPVSLSSKINSVKYLINVNNYDTYYDTISNNNFTKANAIYHIPSTSSVTSFGASFEGSSLSVSIILFNRPSSKLGSTIYIVS